jgi:hypothetical protein
MSHPMHSRLRTAILIAVLQAVTSGGAARAEELVAIEGCTLVPADWADGDSFRIRTPAGDEHVAGPATKASGSSLPVRAGS